MNKFSNGTLQKAELCM